MFKKWAIGMAALCAATGALAETHYIPSGEDNLIHNFVNGSETVAGKFFNAGDTLVLTDDGPYFNEDLTFPTDVTIRAAKGVLPDFTGESHIRFQANAHLEGLFFNEQFVLGGDRNYVVTNCRFNTSSVSFSHMSSIGSIAFIGNQIHADYVFFKSDNIFVMGNHFNLNSTTARNIELISHSNRTIQFIGNEITSTTTSSSHGNDYLVEFDVGKANVIGNRFIQRSIGDNLYLDNFLYFDFGTSGSLIQNNSFQIEEGNGIDSINWRFITFGETDAHYQIFNNVFQSIPSAIQNDPLNAIAYNFSTKVQFANNIIVNYPGNVIAQHGLSSIQNNLCFNGSSALCDSLIAIDNSNMQADPQFASTDTFALSAGSPAIDAGIDSVRHQDSKDNSRNDLGVFGGAFPIDFFDQQLDPNATQPYLYPLIHVQDTATENTLRVKAVAFARQ